MKKLIITAIFMGSQLLSHACDIYLYTSLMADADDQYHRLIRNCMRAHTQWGGGQVDSVDYLEMTSGGQYCLSYVNAWYANAAQEALVDSGCN